MFSFLSHLELLSHVQLVGNCYLRQGGYVSPGVVCFSVCLSVCLLATLLSNLAVLSGISTTVTTTAVCLQCRRSSRVLGEEVGAHTLSPLLRELHWLKVPERISSGYGFSHIVAFNDMAPSYLAETLHLTADVGSRRRLHHHHHHQRRDYRGV